MNPSAHTGDPRRRELDEKILSWMNSGSWETDEARFDTLACELFCFQFDHVPAYARFSEAHGATPNSISHWSEIPAVPTSAFKEKRLHSFDEAETVKLGGLEVQSRAYVSRFNFSGSDQQKKVGALSGGERNRVHLARMLKEGANFLLLDEPTNDLDVNTLRALEEALLEFGGTALLVSHDRWFLDRIATHMLAFEGDSNVVWFDGNYSDYEADRKRRLGKDAERPHPIRYKKLSKN